MIEGEHKVKFQTWKKAWSLCLISFLFYVIVDISGAERQNGKVL